MTSEPTIDPTGVEETADRLSRRPWLATPLRSRPTLSFEFFPPPSRAGWNQLCDTVETLGGFDPAFVSITYGAGGSTRTTTQRAAETLHAAYGLDVAGHLTTIAATRAEVDRQVDRYADIGMTRLVALRGDAPKDTTGPLPQGYEAAEDLVRAVRARGDGAMWDISVAGYPETHPRAASAAADIESLKRKVDAGADRVITQFFYDNEVFFGFVERARAAGITVPIVPGVMPIHDFDGVVRFANRCGTTIPAWMHELFDPIEDASIRRLVAATVAAEQVRDLVEWGVQHLHFYTLNRADLAEAVLRMLGYQQAQAEVITLDRASETG